MNKRQIKQWHQLMTSDSIADSIADSITDSISNQSHLH
jgi:hypothetical protein